MPEPIKPPVFFDPSQRRWRLSKYILVVTAQAWYKVVGIFVIIVVLRTTIITKTCPFILPAEQLLLVLALMLGMIFIFAMAVSILSVSSLADQDSILPQALVHAGPEIAHPSNSFTGNSREQLQQMVATLNNLTSTAQDTAVPPIDLPPES